MTQRSNGIAGDPNSRPPTIIAGRKLRPLVISMGGERETHIRALFHQMKEEFEEPVFSPGIPQRSLRTRSNFFPIAYEAGLIPKAEWEALKVGIHSKDYQLHTEQLYECLKDVPVTEHRKGNDHDVKLHYSVEFWRKAKGLNRGRAVLACTLAHLTAMKKCVDEGFDFILEDNVRAPMEECAKRIKETMRASEELAKETGTPCHLRYFGWLGSIPNLKWVLNTHAKRMAYRRKQTDDSLCIDNTVFPLPISEDFGFLSDEPEEEEEEEETVDEKTASRAHKKPGGTAIWGAYAYWISKEGYEALMERLRLDVGALMWKGKRMRCYVAKPVDKVMPRQIVASYSRECIHVANCPAFFRAPMLTSKIHAQWDPEFCKSTEYQLRYTMLGWEDLWLTPAERSVVTNKKVTGEWITPAQLLDIQTVSDEFIQR